MVKPSKQVKTSLKEYYEATGGQHGYDSTAARIQSLTEKFAAATPGENAGGHRAGVTGGPPYVDNHGFSGYSYPPPPPPPPPPHGYAPEFAYGAYGHSHYPYGPSHYVGPHAGLPPPPPPPPGAQQYYRGAPASMADERDMYLSLPPPPPSAGMSQYGHLRANFIPPGEYGHPSYAPAPDMPHSALYGMPPPPPPPMHPPARTNGQRLAGEGVAAVHTGDGHNQGAAVSNGHVYSNGHHHAENGNGSVVQGSKAQPRPADRNGSIAVSHVEQRPAEAAPVAQIIGQQRGKAITLGSIQSKLVVADAQPASSPAAAAAVVKEVSVVPPSPVKEESIPAPVEAPAKVEEQVNTEVPLLADTPVESVHSTVKNAFAERLAQQALARLASRASGTVRTDLLRDVSGLDVPVAPTAAKVPDVPQEPAAVPAPKVTEPARVAEKQAPEPPAARVPSFSMQANGGDGTAFRPTRAAAVSSAASVTSERGPGSTASGDEPAAAAALVEVGEGRDVGGDDASHRQRLKLQPRTLPVDAAAAGAALEEARRKLQLQPRTKDTAAADDRGRVPTSAKDVAPTASNGVPKGPSIFGAARPREEVLKERGLDPSSALDLDSGLGGGRPSFYAGSAHHGYGSATLSGRGSRAASVTSGISGDDHGKGDDWKKVGRSRAREDMYVPVTHDIEPLLGVFSGPGHRAAPTRFFGEGNGGYVSAHNNGGWQDGYGYSGNPSGSYSRNVDVDDGLVIRRSLPIRSDF